MVEPKGLSLAAGQLTRDSSALVVANNVVVEAPGVIRSRQGYERQADAFGGPVWKMLSFDELAGDLLVNSGTGTSASTLERGDGTGAFTLLASNVTNQPGTRMKGAVANRSIFLTADNGIHRVNASNAVVFAGEAQGLGLDLSSPAAVLVSTPGFLPDASAVAYRVTFVSSDLEGREIEGAPSSRTVVYNKTGTSGWVVAESKDVLCRVILPKANGYSSTGLSVGTVVRLWRSKDSTSTPSDDMRLVYQVALVAGDITAGYVDITDIVPESFRVLAPPLYTNASDGGDVGFNGTTGILQSNSVPPRARDLQLFAGCLWGADLLYRQRFLFTILSVSATGLSTGDTITIGSFTYTAVAGAPANNQFNVSGAASVSEAIERTALDLVRAINVSTTNTEVYAFYVSSPNGLPGQILLEARTTGQAVFSISTTGGHGMAFRPQLTGTATSVADEFGNGLFFSKQFQPNAVPTVNLIRVGRDYTKVLAIRVLAEVLYVFTDMGIYRLTGRTFDDFQLEEFDLSFRILGRELVSECDDALWAWGREGIARVDSAGVTYISNPIEPMLWLLIKNSSLSFMNAAAFSTAYRGRHKVVFGYPSGTTLYNCPSFLVYDTRTGAWTTWSFARDPDALEGRSCAVVNVNDDRLWFGQWNSGGFDAYVWRERLSYATTDFQDDFNDGTTAGITRTMQWVPTVADPALLVRWVDLHIWWEKNETISAWTTPSVCTAQFTADYSGSASITTIAPVA
ncbi:MAG: hypothetical protein NTV51_03880, partial [Verrucomicrobia bacterium]|nr:hypothetical protein [Verrucomicrobiota bacterium]